MCGLFSIDYSYPNNIKKADPEGLGKKTLNFGPNELIASRKIEIQYSRHSILNYIVMGADSVGLGSCM